MDAVLTTLLGAAPQLSGAGALITFLVILVRREHRDRGDYRAGLSAVSTRHIAELSRLNTDHIAELAELRREIVGLRGQLEEVNRKLDVERDRRRAAEDRRPPSTWTRPWEAP